ncbi:pre-mRNA-splicing factor SLU7-like protein [Tanacetum coccineum]
MANGSAYTVDIPMLGFRLLLLGTQLTLSIFKLRQLGGHAKDCVEKTRKVGAKWTGENIAFDEKIEKIVFDYDGKRDRWNSYDATSYADVIYRYEAHDNQNKVSGQALEFKQTNMHALAQFYIHLCDELQPQADALKRKAHELE